MAEKDPAAVEASVSQNDVAQRPLHIENIEDLDTQNKYAVKSDDSDGKVNWTIQRFVAMGCLSMLFVGMAATLLNSSMSVISLTLDVFQALISSCSSLPR